MKRNLGRSDLANTPVHEPGVEERFLIEDFSSLKPSMRWCYEGEVHDVNRNFASTERHNVAWLLLKGSVVLETRDSGGSGSAGSGGKDKDKTGATLGSDSSSVSRDSDFPQRLSALAGEWIFSGPDPRHQRFSEDAAILSLSFRLEWPSGDPLISQPAILSAKQFPALARTARPLARLVERHFPEVRAHLWKCGTEVVLFFEMQRLFA